MPRNSRNRVGQRQVRVGKSPSICNGRAAADHKRNGGCHLRSAVARNLQSRDGPCATVEGANNLLHCPRFRPMVTGTPVPQAIRDCCDQLSTVSDAYCPIFATTRRLPGRSGISSFRRCSRRQPAFRRRVRSGRLPGASRAKGSTTAQPDAQDSRHRRLLRGSSRPLRRCRWVPDPRQTVLPALQT